MHRQLPLHARHPICAPKPLHPEGKYELKRFALALGPKVKVHDLLMEAIEEWAQRKGIAAPMRVASERPRRGQ